MFKVIHKNPDLEKLCIAKRAQYVYTVSGQGRFDLVSFDPFFDNMDR